MSHALADAGRYARQLIRYRHFWVHLALADLRARFRRSYLGIFWLMLQPLLLTLIISAVFIFVFKQQFADYAVYLFSGTIAWDFVTGSVLIGAMSFIAAESYVRQARLPMMGYPLKAVLYCCIVFGLALLGFTLFALAVKPSIFSWRWVYLVPFTLTLIAFGAPLAIISAIVNIKFRDYQQSMAIVLQMLWYMSPILVMREVFDRPGLSLWTAVNPIASLMDILRDPLLNGLDPRLGAYGVVLAWAAVLWVGALYLLARNERKIVFYY